MSELDEAIARLEAAVARLEAASERGAPPGDGDHLVTVAAAIAARVDTALARLGRLLDREE